MTYDQYDSIIAKYLATNPYASDDEVKAYVNAVMKNAVLSATKFSNEYNKVQDKNMPIKAQVAYAQKNYIYPVDNSESQIATNARIAVSRDFDDSMMHYMMMQNMMQNMMQQNRQRPFGGYGGVLALLAGGDLLRGSMYNRQGRKFKGEMEDADDRRSKAHKDLETLGYKFNAGTGKWDKGSASADIDENSEAYRKWVKAKKDYEEAESSHNKWKKGGNPSILSNMFGGGY